MHTAWCSKSPLAEWTTKGTMGTPFLQLLVYLSPSWLTLTRWGN